MSIFSLLATIFKPKREPPKKRQAEHNNRRSKMRAIELGQRGEKLVKKELTYQLSKNDYYQIHNVTLTSGEKTTQIDHIVVSLNGIFVIETKHRQGWIFANSRSKFWTQISHQNKYKFFNPLIQNSKHIKSLQEITSLPRRSFHSVIVFTAYPEFKTDTPKNVLLLDELIPFIDSKTKKIVTKQEARNSILDIRASDLSTEKADDANITYLKE